MALCTAMALSLTAGVWALGPLQTEIDTGSAVATTSEAPGSSRIAALVPVVSAQDEGADAAALGRQLFDEHLAYLMAGDVDGMVDNLYTDDAVLITPFDVLDTPPPNIVRGNGAIKAYFRLFVVSQGDMNLEDVYDFAQTDSSISFQMIFTSRTGRWVVGNAWHLTRGKIDTQYTFAQRLGDAPR